MARVTGIGGVFFKVADPATTVGWYRDHLGIEPEDDFPCATFKSSDGESLVWAPFADETEYFGTSGQTSMVNYRVDDLDGSWINSARLGYEWTSGESMPTTVPSDGPTTATGDGSNSGNPPKVTDRDSLPSGGLTPEGESTTAGGDSDQFGAHSPTRFPSGSETTANRPSSALIT